MVGNSIIGGTTTSINTKKETTKTANTNRSGSRPDKDERDTRTLKEIETMERRYTDEREAFFAENLIALRSSGEDKKYMDEVRRLDSHFRHCAVWTVLVWLSLLRFVYTTIPQEKFEVLDGAEKYSAMFTLAFLFVSVGGQILKLYATNQWQSIQLSGILIGSFTVQAVALTSNLLLVSTATPVVDYPIFGTRAHVVRYCEWVPLACYMSFMTTGIDGSAGLSEAYITGASQLSSTFIGLILPLVQDVVDTRICLVLSTIFYCYILYMVWDKRKRFKQMEPQVCSLQIELYERAGLSLKISCICASAWTLLVVCFFVAGFGQLYAAEGSMLRSSDFAMIWESLMDVILKNMYMSMIVDVHKRIFDDKERAERRLGELRRLMRAVWESSGDVICVSVRRISGGVRTMVSPAYCRYFLGMSPDQTDNKAILFDIEDESVKDRMYSKLKFGDIQSVDFNSLTTLRSRTPLYPTLETTTSEVPGLETNLMASLAGMVARGWNAGEGETRITHRLLKVNGEDRVFAPCEANVCRLEEDSILLVVRDISERSKRFEAEKKMIFETTAREKDAEANRFTRHEVKNGLLAAIALCENLKENTYMDDSSGDESSVNETFDLRPPAASVASSSIESIQMYKKSPSQSIPYVAHCTKELDKTLKDILDTVLSEAMARDVIHGVYEPKMQDVDTKKTLKASHGFDKDHAKFPILTETSPMPTLYLDPQLLTFIHRNAVSNACKYGLKGGTVTTRIYFDFKNQEFLMEVENSPGEGHDRLMYLGTHANEAVFSPATRLHESGMESTNHKGRSLSSGDGAWIMKKCAKILNGNVDIRFENERTVFSFSCPAQRYDDVMLSKKVNAKTFRLPPNIWGVAIDDSNIQRKLLSNLLSFSGIDSPRQFVLGARNTDITNFVTFVVQLIQSHPSDYFLLIVDENLEIEEDRTYKSTVSGSLCIESIRRSLSEDQERQMIALVRSANDSAEDVAVYKSRAHGVLSKAPIRKGTVLRQLAPLWEERFNENNKSQQVPSVARVECSPPKRHTAIETDPMTDFAFLLREELLQSLDAIDELCSGEESLQGEKWPLIWEKLHCLKGDLLSSFSTEGIKLAAQEINAMRGKKLPKDFYPRWTALRSQISACIKMKNFLEDVEIDNINSSVGSKHARSESLSMAAPSRKKSRRRRF